MTLHQLKVFATVAELKSVTLASQKLHMSQPAVSIQLKQLEFQYGLPLIEIIGKKVHLTEAGKKVHAAYLATSECLRNLDTEISELKGFIKGELKIAVVSTAKYFIPQLLGDFHHKYPHVEIKLVVSNREEVIKRLKENKDDLVVLSQLPKKMNIMAHQFLEDFLVVPATLNHPLLKRKNLSFKELASETFINREPGSGTRMVMEKLFEKYQINPKIIMELGSSTAVTQAVIAGFGLSIISKMSIEQELLLKKLALLDIKNFPIKHPWYLVYAKSKKLSLTAINFLRFLELKI
jgi:DNA-binding transcriptional LysR family regulator